jgi:hypothetical protein
MRNHFAKSKEGKCADLYVKYLQWKGYDVGRWCMGYTTYEHQKGENWCLDKLPTNQQVGDWITASYENSS